MCIMAIHATATTANAIQAAAHNADTTARDLRQLADLLIARDDAAAKVQAQANAIDDIARDLWRRWRDYVGPDARPTPVLTSTGYEADRKMDAEVRT